jgi:hypothetical protein
MLSTLTAIPRLCRQENFASIPSPDEAARILQAKADIVKAQDKRKMHAE